MKQKRDFVTADLYTAAFLSIHLNQFPSFRVESGKTLFIFPSDAALYKAINAYNAGISLNAFEFAQQIKRLRGEMLSRRGTRIDEMEKRNEREDKQPHFRNRRRMMGQIFILYFLKLLLRKREKNLVKNKDSTPGLS